METEQIDSIGKSVNSCCALYSRGVCPECGGIMRDGGGCPVCLECGYSKCS